MKIVDRETFLAMPPYTLYSEFKPYVWGDLFVKGDTREGDFTLHTISNAVDCGCGMESIDQIDKAVQSGESLRMNFDLWERDGRGNKEQLFAVWEPQDVEALIERLKQCLPKIVESLE